MMYGNGKKDGVQKLWLHKDQDVLVEQLMDIVIDYIHQHYMQILWINIHNHKYVDYL